MPVLELPAAFRVQTRQARVRVPGETLGAALTALRERHPGTGPLLFTEAGQLRRGLSLFVGEEDVRHGAGLATPLTGDQVVVLVTALAGG